MKINMLLATLLAATPVIPAYAAPSAGAVANVKIALTLKTSVPGTFERNADGKIETDSESGERVPTNNNSWTVVKGSKTTEYSELNIKNQSFRYGNKEFLEDLLDAGSLPDDTITGWAVKAITFGSSSEPGFYLIKKDQPPLFITSNLDLTPVTEEDNFTAIGIYSINQLITETTVGEGDPVTKIKGQGQSEVLAIFTISVDGKGGDLHGLATLNQKAVSASDTQYVYLLKVSMPVAGKFVMEDANAFAKGSISISGAKLVKDFDEFFGDR